MPAKKDLSNALTSTEVKTWALDKGYSNEEATKLAAALQRQNGR